MKKTLKRLAVLMTVLAMLFALAACGNSGGEPAPAPQEQEGQSQIGQSSGEAEPAPDEGGEAEEPAGIQDENTYEWSFSVAASAMPLMEDYVKFIDERTEGHIKITLYDNNSFGSASDILTMTQDGTLDLFYGGVSQFGGVFNVGLACDIPFIYDFIDDVYNMQHALWDAGYLDKEMNNDTLHIAFLNCTDMQRIAFKSQKVEKPEDFNGLKIRNNASYLVPVFEDLGAVPSSIRVSEVYLSLETGVIDAAISSPESMCNYSYQEVCDYLLSKPLYGGTMIGMMNTNTYNSLSDEMKEIFDKANEDFMVYQLDYMKGVEQDSIQKMIDGGIEYYDASPELDEALNAYSAAAEQEYVDNLNSLGFPGEEILDCILSAID